MAPRREVVPNKAEIADQLRRMLDSDMFKSKPQQAKVFEFLVTSHLMGKEVGEREIRGSCFPTPPYDPLSAIVRTTINNIRDQLLPKYYALKSKDDLIKILLPSHLEGRHSNGKKGRLRRGQSYRPVSRYNDEHEDIRLYRRALQRMSQKSPEGMLLAMGELAEVLKKRPDLGTAYVAFTEAAMFLALWGPGMEVNFFNTLEMMAEKAVQYSDEDDWHASAVYAAACMLNYEKLLAYGSFDLATRQDHDSTRHYPWFQVYYFLSGRSGDALGLMKIAAEDAFDAAYRYALLALFLYMKREFREATDEAQTALDLDHNCWLAYLVLALVNLADADSSHAYFSIRQLQRCMDEPNSFLLPGVAALAYAGATDLPEEERFAMISKAVTQEPMASHQRALCMIAQEKPSEAIHALSDSFARREPLVLFLPYLPLFDSLRDDHRFQALLECIPTFPELYKGTQ